MGLFGVLHLCDFSRETTEEVEWGSLGSTDVGKEERELKVEREVIQETSKYLKYCEDNIAAPDKAASDGARMVLAFPPECLLPPTKTVFAV